VDGHPLSGAALVPDWVDPDNKLPGRGEMEIGQVQKRSRPWYGLLRTSELICDTFGYRRCVPQFKIDLIVSHGKMITQRWESKVRWPGLSQLPLGHLLQRDAKGRGNGYV
jgi:hypothetical protein